MALNDVAIYEELGYSEDEIAYAVALNKVVRFGFGLNLDSAFLINMLEINILALQPEDQRVETIRGLVH